jgi:hypothetical protein
VSKLNEEQQMWVCAQIDHWYFEWKPKFPPDMPHPLGVAKEQLKNKLCETSYERNKNLQNPR